MWQFQYFGSTNCALCGESADFDGDGQNNLDLGIFKNNHFGKDGHLNLQLRGEFFNVANHVRFGFPGLAFGNATFGVISTKYNNPRQAQVAAKFIF